MRISDRFLSGVMGLVVAVAAGVRAAPAFDQTHAAFDQVLKQHVRDGWVNYTAIKAAPQPLNAYLDTLAAVPEADFKTWPEKDRLAFLFNLYNAATLKLIVDHYPIASIKKIGGFFNFGGLGDGPWKQKIVRLFGQITTLDHVEHGIIRKDYAEARAHFALVCAARGCPPLRAEAFVGAKLDTQLDEQGRIFLGQAEKNRVDAPTRVLHLSPIFKWFAGDFEAAAGSVEKFVTPFLPEPARRALAAGDCKIRYTDYDWSLNDAAKK
ncbi:MAG: DUF547 domain-containing protein [Opitutaceae bacterium]